MLERVEIPRRVELCLERLGFLDPAGNEGADGAAEVAVGDHPACLHVGV